MESALIKNANIAFKEKDYVKALRLYKDAMKKQPALQESLKFNVSLAEKRLAESKHLVSLQTKNSKVIVYTCNFGDYESVKEPLCIDPNAKYMLFTDNKNLTSENWQVVVIEEKLDDARRTSRLPKILPHKYLPPHDISIYIDSSLEFKVENVAVMAEQCLKDSPLALYEHYKRNCVYEEIDFVLNSKDRVVATPEKCLLQIEKYKKIGYPKNNGLYENAFIIRRNNKEVEELNELWWKEYLEGAERDQFVLMYALDRLGLKVNSISIGEQFRKNPFVNFYKHAYVPSVQPYENNIELIKIGEDNSAKKPVVNWVVGGEDNKGWAYENNADRFIQCMPQYEHKLSFPEFTNVAIYFDVLLYDRYPVASDINILRIGGPRPLARLCEGDSDKLKQVVENFHSVICLNNDLTEKLKAVHPNVYLVPNGVDLIKFSPKQLQHEPNREFTVGFAGSAKSSAERDVKGLDLAIEACKLSKVKFLNVGRGKGQVQIPHDKMVEDFYSKIDVLLHPVGPGREGSSNVIMEALALGIPVITTEHSGYHAEQLSHGVNFLLCKRKPRHIAGHINALKNDQALRQLLSANGRAFAISHHDIKRISDTYLTCIKDALSYKEASKKISFNPFWFPVENFATGRIRSLLPSRLLNRTPGIGAKLGYDAAADIVLISQLASDDLLEKINKNSKQFVIYDVCDKYYEDDRIVGGVNAKKRFFEILNRANLITTSTLELKKDLYNLKVKKPVVCVQDGIDFQLEDKKKDTEHCSMDKDLIGWFGNPGRGNLDSAVWMLEEALKQHKKIKLITKIKSVKPYPRLYPHAVEWKCDSFLEELSKCSVAVVSHADDEQNKSPNRLLTAISNKVPVIVSNSRSCEQILRSVGLEWAIVRNKEQFLNALELLEKKETRDMYFKLLEPYVNRSYGNASIAKKYVSLLKKYFYSPGQKKKKVLFVSHNLSIGEGAPTSLFQTVIGLKKYHNVEAHVFCPMTGDFRAKYEEHGVPIYNYTSIVSKDSLKPLNANFEKAKGEFQKYINKNAFDLVICNTAKMLPYASFAIECNVPAISIVRESSEEHINLTFSKNSQITAAAHEGLRKVKKVVFVSDVTRSTWQQKQSLPSTEVIHNGIITDQWHYLRDVSKENLRAKLGLPLNKNILLSVGTINGRKAQIDIVNAYQKLPKDIIDKTFLVLVGARESGYLTQFENALEKLPLPIRQNVLLVPETEKVGEWYKASDVFVFASHNESYPRVIVEALYFELKIVSSEVFGVKEQINESDSSFLFDIGDIDAMRDCIIKAVESAENNVGSQARFYEITDYQLMLAQYYQVIDRNTV